jgi:hypothetical protein
MKTDTNRFVNDHAVGFVAFGAPLRRGVAHIFFPKTLIFVVAESKMSSRIFTGLSFSSSLNRVFTRWEYIVII